MDGSIAENVVLSTEGSDINEERALECLKNLQLADFVANSPDGIHRKIGQMGVAISGDQRQRLTVLWNFSQ